MSAATAVGPAAHIHGLHSESSSSSERFCASGDCNLIGCVVVAESGTAALVAVGDNDDVDAASLMRVSAPGGGCCMHRTRRIQRTCAVSAATVAPAKASRSSGCAVTKATLLLAHVARGRGWYRGEQLLQESP